MTPQGEHFKTIGQGIVYRPRQITSDSNDNLFISDIHAHVPTWDSADIDKEYIWRIDRNCAWVWAFSKAGELLGTSLDVEQTLTLVSELLVDELADWCSVMMVEDGRLRTAVQRTEGGSWQTNTRS